MYHILRYGWIVVFGVTCYFSVVSGSMGMVCVILLLVSLPISGIIPRDWELTLICLAVSAACVLMPINTFGNTDWKVEYLTSGGPEDRLTMFEIRAMRFHQGDLGLQDRFMGLPLPWSYHMYDVRGGEYSIPGLGMDLAFFGFLASITRRIERRHFRRREKPDLPLEAAA